MSARTGSSAETAALAGAFSAALRPGDVVLLSGDLGAGKTTFTQGLAKALGVAELVTSPTFTLLRSYTCSSGTRGEQLPTAIGTLLHADLFRLEHLREVVDLAIDELLEESSVAVVEWGDVGAPVLGEGALAVSISHAGEGEAPGVRILTFELCGAWAPRRHEVTAAIAAWLETPADSPGGRTSDGHRQE